MRSRRCIIVRIVCSGIGYTVRSFAGAGYRVPETDPTTNRVMRSPRLKKLDSMKIMIASQQYFLETCLNTNVTDPLADRISHSHRPLQFVIPDDAARCTKVCSQHKSGINLRLSIAFVRRIAYVVSSRSRLRIACLALICAGPKARYRRQTLLLLPPLLLLLLLLLFILPLLYSQHFFLDLISFAIVLLILFDSRDSSFFFRLLPLFQLLSLHRYSSFLFLCFVPVSREREKRPQQKCHCHRSETASH